MTKHKEPLSDFLIKLGKKTRKHERTIIEHTGKAAKNVKNLAEETGKKANKLRKDNDIDEKLVKLNTYLTSIGDSITEKFDKFTEEHKTSENKDELLEEVKEYWNNRQAELKKFEATLNEQLDEWNTKATEYVKNLNLAEKKFKEPASTVPADNATTNDVEEAVEKLTETAKKKATPVVKKAAATAKKAGAAVKDTAKDVKEAVEPDSKPVKAAKKVTATVKKPVKK